MRSCCYCLYLKTISIKYIKEFTNMTFYVILLNHLMLNHICCNRFYITVYASSLHVICEAGSTFPLQEIMLQFSPPGCSSNASPDQNLHKCDGCNKSCTISQQPLLIRIYRKLKRRSYQMNYENTV